MNMQRPPSAILAVLFAASSGILLASPSSAQCTPQWFQGDGFDLRGGTATDTVNAVVQMPNGDLIAAGQFASVAGIPAENIARWNGSAWSSLGAGVAGGEVRALAVLPNGDLVAGGQFTSAGGIAVNKIARWDGLQWSPLGSGLSGTSGGVTEVQALTVLPNGDLVAGGHFTAAGGVAAMNIAVWSGTWSAMATGLVNPGQVAPPLSVSALVVQPNGILAAATDSGSSYVGRVVRWTGASWAEVGSFGPFSERVRSLASMPNNDLIAGTSVVLFGSHYTYVKRWDGSFWTNMGTANTWQGNVRAITVLGNGDIVCGGSFTSMSGVAAVNLVKWNGATWSSIGDIGGEVKALMTLANGVTVAAGSFGPTSSVDCYRLGRWGCDPTIATQERFGLGCYWRATSFYEDHASPHAFDLSSSTLHLSLTPVGYDITHVTGVPAWHAPTSAAEPLGDDSVTAAIALPFNVPYPGGSTNHIVVSSNGYVFLQPSSDASAYYGNTGGLLQQAPRHAPMWGDLDPMYPGTGSGEIHVDVSGQVAHVTWLGVTAYANPSVTSTFQIALAANGDVEYRYLACDNVFPVLTGWSPGLGSLDPTSRDLSAAGPFSTTSVMFRLPLMHAADQRAKFGSAVTLTTSRLDSASLLGLNMIGFTKYPSGIELSSLGMPDCLLLVSLDLLFPFLPVAQSGSHTVVIPNQPVLPGLELHTQGAAWDLSANAGGIVVSNGVSLRIGFP